MVCPFTKPLSVRCLLSHAGCGAVVQSRDVFISGRGGSLQSRWSFLARGFKARERVTRLCQVDLCFL